MQLLKGGIAEKRQKELARKECRNTLQINSFAQNRIAFLEEPSNRDALKRAAVMGVKGFPHWSQNDEISASDTFVIAESVRHTLASLKPAEFIQLFPIQKEYRGKRWGLKDYFFTMEALEAYNPSESISIERIDDFLWDYHNHDIREFWVCVMSVVSNLHREQSGKGLAEEFFEELGVKTYYKYEDEAGNEFMYDPETGESLPIKKPKPRYLKLVE